MLKNRLIGKGMKGFEIITRNIKMTLIGLGFVITTGCSPNYQLINDVNNKTVPEIQKLAKNQSALLIIANDGYGDGEVHTGSGIKTTDTICHILQPYFKSIKIVGLESNFNEQMKSAYQKGYQYVIEPELNTWVDSFTFWTGVPDQIELNLKIYDAKTQKQLESYTIKSESSLTPRPNQKPQDLLYQPLNQIAQVIFNDKQTS